MERAIRFNDEMVRAILDGRKTQTRRPVRYVEAATGVKVYFVGQTVTTDFEKIDFDKVSIAGERIGDRLAKQSPFGMPGDTLWIQEAFALNMMGTYDYRASVHPDYHPDFTWRSSTQMPREASRINLLITGFQIARVNDITRGDCMAEGCPFPNMEKGENPVDWFASLWDSIYAKKGYSWESNPWVYVIDFKVMTSGEGR